MHNNHITKLLDLPDLNIIDFIQQEDQYVFVVKAKNESTICPECAIHVVKVHDLRWQNIKDQPIRDKKTDPKRKIILDILPSRKKEDIIDYLEQWPKEHLKK